MVFLDENSIDAFKIKAGDKVKRISNGNVYIAINGTGKVNGKYAPIWWLKHCASYGENFIKLN